MSSTAPTAQSLLDESSQVSVVSAMVAASLPGGKPANISRKRWRLRAKELSLIHRAQIFFSLEREFDENSNLKM